MKIDERKRDEDEQQPHRISLRADDADVVHEYANQFGVAYEKHFEIEEELPVDNKRISQERMESLDARLMTILQNSTIPDL